MCQVSSFNLDHEKCVQGCNCCKSKDSAAAVSATLAERERIIKLLEEMIDACLSVKTQIGNHNASTLENAIALIKGASND